MPEQISEMRDAESGRATLGNRTTERREPASRDAECRGRLNVGEGIVPDHQRAFRLDSKSFEGEHEDRAFGLSHSDHRGIDHDVYCRREFKVDQAPFEIPGKIGDDAGANTAGAERA
jgi:hypothetical protein